ncbi:hypothetical protein [Methylocystis bryophila]|uniref:Uncharacterized protein n=1 Tax=Methylocystis bryophila TaxID=655015 RepID=A0A1W6MS50_9HYPH|nr:hypothetical protein [Methylocystis bryophila]ARN80428.1 hypothetical protein B1812_04315 [Methylocystis bryophila]BDV40434.1 hypothetical protein DSM21852_36870 [Methylocystis bryophila]
MLFELDEGTAIMGVAFVQLLEDKLPRHQEISAQAVAVAAWIWDNALTDEQRRAVAETLPADFGRF